MKKLDTRNAARHSRNQIGQWRRAEIQNPSAAEPQPNYCHKVTKTPKRTKNSVFLSTAIR